MIDRPLVSVIIPTYNRADLIGRALKSVFGQTYDNLQVLVVDNASTDNTAEAVGVFKDPRLKFIRHDINKGPAASRNTGLKRASGDYIAFLDSDDEWLAQKIELQLGVFKNEKEEIGLVFTNGFNEAKKGMAITDPVDSGIYYDPRRDKFYPLKKLITTPSGWMLPAYVAKKTGYFDERMVTWDDGDYLARIAYGFPLYFLNKDLVVWHASSEHLNIMNRNLVDGKEIFLHKNYDFLRKDREYLFRFYRSLGKDLLFFDRAKAREYLYKALKMNPFDFSTMSKIARSFAGGQHA